MSKVLILDDILKPDRLGCEIATKFQTWDDLRKNRISEWQEVLEYVFATDTTKTSNAKLPWSNKTTVPKLCQIRENLHVNYLASMFPKAKWLQWEGANAKDETLDKIEAVESYMQWVVSQNRYYDTVSRLVLDYIDYGNCFAMVEWIDETVAQARNEQVGYVGPALRRVSPLDIVFDPRSDTFESSPKIIRSITNMGEVKRIISQQFSGVEEQAIAHELMEYFKEVRSTVGTSSTANVRVKDRLYEISGYSSYQAYCQSGDVELLTFYGDIYDSETEELLRNHIIIVADRHKLIYKKPNETVFGYAPIFHAGWRLRPDNLWAAGPLDNLVGMQYRIDHLENMKADCFDLIAYPPLKVKGYVENFDWGPMERIYVGDDGDVSMLAPDINVLQADNQIAILEAKMEEMAGAPKEALGFRTPGEKTKYEVQSLENAAGRIFQHKTAYFEQHVIEKSLNAKLELARRYLTPTTIRVFDDEYKMGIFKELSRYDIAGVGQLRALAARHFAEQANTVQNLSNFLNSSAGQDPAVLQHFSAVKLASMWERLLELQPYRLVEPYVRIAEAADAQRFSQTHEEQVAVESQTPSGMNGDFDLEELP